MSDETTGVLVEAYSTSEDHMYEITKNSMNQYDLWVFGYDEKMKGYHMLSEHRKLADSLEEATQMGNDLLEQLG